MTAIANSEGVLNPLSDAAVNKAMEETEEETMSASVSVPKGEANQCNRKKYFLYFLAIVFLSTVVDILVYSFSDKHFKVETSRLILESDNADAELFMSAHVKLNSFFHSFNANEGNCRFFYIQEDSIEKRQVGEIYGHFDHDSDSPKAQNEVEILFQLHNTDYTQLRHMLRAYHTGSKATTSVKCSAQGTVNAFKVFPITMNVHSNTFFDWDFTFQDDFSLEKETEEIVMLQLPKKIIKFVEETFIVKDVSAKRIDIQASTTINTISQDSPYPVNSFVVEMPKLSYSIISVARSSTRETDPSRDDTDVAAVDTRIVMSSSPVAVELGQAAGGDTTPISTTLSVTCSQLDTAGELMSETKPGEHCSMFTALHLGTFIEEISQGHVHIHADSSRANFVSSLLGESHFVTAQKFDPPGAASNGRALTDMLSPRDPDVSNGASCMVVDGDSMAESVVCFEVDKGFMMTYLDVYDSDGSMAVIKGTTAWNVGGGFAFDGQYVVMARGGHLVVANVTASEDFQNASALLSYHQDENELIHANVFSTWDTWHGNDNLPAADVRYWVQYDENYNAPGRFNSTGEFSFGDAMYSLHATQDSSLNSGGEWVGVGSANGQYTGELWDWQFTVDASQYAVDNDVKGSMTALLSSLLKTDGSVVVMANVLDGSEVEVVDTATSAIWSTNTAWDVEGSVDVNSLWTSSFIDWNNYNSLDYNDKAYVLKLEHFDQDEYERMYVSANGTCGGVETDWHLAVENSELWLDESKKGTMEMLLSSEVNYPGTVGDLRLDVEVLETAPDGLGEGILVTTQNRAQWNTPPADEWTTEGHVNYMTLMYMPDIVDWNSDGYFQYANSMYDTRLAVYDYDTGEDNYVVFAEGAFHGDLSNWWASVEDSSFQEFEELVGTMSGEMSSWIYSAGKGVNMTALMVVKGASGSEFMVTDNTLGWEGYGADSSWGNGGKAALESEFYYDDLDSGTLSWHINDNFQFADNTYSFSSLSLDREADTRWALNGDGLYNGEMQDFTITLEYSELVLSEDLFGTAVGEVRAHIPGTGTDGEIYFSSAASDANGIEAMGTSNKAVWFTVSSWGSQGLVDFNSSFYVDSCADCGAVVSWNVKEHFVHDDGTYNFILINEKTNGDDLFLVSASGEYGGEMEDWWLSLVDSDLVIDEKDYGAATGLLSAEVRDNGEWADISLLIQAENDAEIEIMYLNMLAKWNTDSMWSESGNIDYSIALQLMETTGDTFLGPPFVVYGSDSLAGNYQASWIYTCPGDFIEVSLCDDRATCYEDTYLALFQNGVELAQNDDYCGMCSSVYFSAWNSSECGEVEVRYGCYGNSVCSGSAAIYQQSFPANETKPTSYLLDFNRYQKLSYGGNKYSHETRLYESNGQERLYSVAQGMYGGEIFDWFFTVDNAEFRYMGVNQGNLTLTLSSQISNDGTKGDLTVYILTHVPSRYTGVDEEELKTTNTLAWDGQAASRFISAHFFTDTLMSTEPQFFLETALNINNVAKKADFFLVDTVMGEEKVDANATAWYSTQTGMVTGIDMTVRYEESPLFSASMFLNAQTESLSQPSGVPTGLPTAEPSGVPSVLPSGEPSGEPSSCPTGEPSVQPSGEPSGQPSGQPSGEPTGQPTISKHPTGQPSGMPSTEPSGQPSGMPSTEPSGEPSGVPSAVPSRVPSGVPSRVPSGVPTTETVPPTISLPPTISPTVYIPLVTVVSFSTLAQLGGVAADDMDLPAQQAFLNVTAGSMTGVQASDLVIIDMNTVVVRHLRSLGAVDMVKRRLASAVDITFTTTSILEDSGYSSASDMAEGLDAEVAVAYADPATAVAFTQEAEALGSTTVDTSTAVVFEEPVLDTTSVTEEVVQTAAPTMTVAVKSSDEDDMDEQTVLLVALMVPIFAVAIIAAAGYAFYRHKKKDPSVAKPATCGGTTIDKGSASDTVANPMIVAPSDQL
mgnify:CR=1 FL=1